MGPGIWKVMDAEMVSKFLWKITIKANLWLFQESIFSPFLVKHTDISVIRWQNPEKWYLPLKLYGSWCASTSKPLLFFETKASKNSKPRALHFQRHLYPPPLHSKFVKITQKIVVQAFHHVFNQSVGRWGGGVGEAWNLLVSGPFLASPAQLSSPCQGSWLASVISRLWGAFGFLPGLVKEKPHGREKPEHFFPSFSTLGAVDVSALWPQIPAGPLGPHLSHVIPVPCLWKRPFSLWSQLHPWGAGVGMGVGRAFQPLLISQVPDHAHLAFQPPYAACIKFPALNLRLNSQCCFSFSGWALIDIVAIRSVGLTVLFSLFWTQQVNHNWGAPRTLHGHLLGTHSLGPHPDALEQTLRACGLSTQHGDTPWVTPAPTSWLRPWKLIQSLWRGPGKNLLQNWFTNNIQQLPAIPV